MNQPEVAVYPIPVTQEKHVRCLYIAYMEASIKAECAKQIYQSEIQKGNAIEAIQYFHSHNFHLNETAQAYKKLWELLVDMLPEIKMAENEFRLNVYKMQIEHVKVGEWLKEMQERIGGI